MDNRIDLIDELRGLAVIIMISFHFIYQENLWADKYASLLNNFYVNLFKFIAQVLFISIAGVCCNFSNDNTKRGLICIYVGLFIDLVSYIVIPKEIITYGIFSFMGTAILVYVILEDKLKSIPQSFGLVLFSVLFIISYLLSYKIISLNCITNNNVFMGLVEKGYFNFMGFKSSNFKSSDFFPILPWIFVFISGTFAGEKIKKLKRRSVKSKFLKVLGRNSMFIYVVHIPVILIVIKLIN